MSEKNDMVFVDLGENFDEGLIRKYYTELAIPNIKITSELEPVENWIALCKDQCDPNVVSTPPFFHLLVAFDLKPGSNEKDLHSLEIMGGLSFEYYPKSNCGLLTYLLVSEKCRGRGLAKILIQKAADIFGVTAKKQGRISGCNAIFLETNSEQVSLEYDVMDPRQRHKIFEKLGFQMLDFDYVQPPITEEKEKCRDLIFCCMVTTKLPTQKSRKYLPSILLQNFLCEFWEICCEITEVGDWEKDTDYLEMMDQLERKKSIALLSVPWVREWTTIDLHTSFDAKLLDEFFKKCVELKKVENLQLLDTWKHKLSASKDSSLFTNYSTPIFHVLVALRSNVDEHKHQLGGGIVFQYFPSSNTGLITHTLFTDENLEKILIREAIETLHLDAFAKGTLVGVNAIFSTSENIIKKEISPLLRWEEVDQQISHKHKLVTLCNLDNPQALPQSLIDNFVSDYELHEKQ
eukprot:TRINITY_DN1920_c0_g1_i1.p1 TRINITY_DN1920_c0_g1~~TRINITY_DN1920_c0_g1_i1.p1  ORF type:complete len:462 (+),score=107.53 TRINITY_DN1920_c0_g1_i1:562-1947(+)